MLATVDHNFRAIGNRDVDVGGNLVAVFSSYQWTHVATAATIAGAQLAHALGDLGNQSVGDWLNGNDNRDCHAPLTCRAKASVNCRVGNQFEICIWQDEHVILRAAQSLHTLAVFGTSLIDILGNWCRADERDCLNIGVS